jgi:imidazolonepropionase-like amidohydrolase
MFLLSFTIGQQTPRTSERALVIPHVTVIDAIGAPATPDVTIMITGNHITELARSSDVVPPRRARVVHVTGEFLIPGLWDMHVHSNDAGKEYLALFVANGARGVRVMGFPSPP